MGWGLNWELFAIVISDGMVVPQTDLIVTLILTVDFFFTLVMNALL